MALAASGSQGSGVCEGVVVRHYTPHRSLHTAAPLVLYGVVLKFQVLLRAIWYNDNMVKLVWFDWMGSAPGYPASGAAGSIIYPSKWAALQGHHCDFRRARSNR